MVFEDATWWWPHLCILPAVRLFLSPLRKLNEIIDLAGKPRESHPEQTQCGTFSQTVQDQTNKKRHQQIYKKLSAFLGLFGSFLLAKKLTSPNKLNEKV
jgi:hypothetical protein